MIGKLADLVFKGTWKWLKRKIAKAVIRILSKEVMPKLKRAAKQYGRDFSKLLRDMAAKKKLGVKTAQDVEGFLEEIMEHFWDGANEDDV